MKWLDISNGAVTSLSAPLSSPCVHTYRPTFNRLGISGSTPSQLLSFCPGWDAIGNYFHLLTILYEIYEEINSTDTVTWISWRECVSDMQFLGTLHTQLHPPGNSLTYTEARRTCLCIVQGVSVAYHNILKTVLYHSVLLPESNIFQILVTGTYKELWP